MEPVARPAKPATEAALGWLALQQAPGIGAAGMLRLVRVFGSPEATLHASTEELVARGSIFLAQARVLTEQRDIRDQLQRKIEVWRAKGISLVCIDDDSYPIQLRDLRTPPPLLYIRGSLLPGDARAIAIVGTRQPTRAGAAFARRIGREFAARGFTIVSGLARGIDTAGHRGSLEVRQGRTIAVLGCGLLRVYPPENAMLADHIAERGSILSEVMPETNVQPGLLLARDRIQAALSRAVIVVQAHGECGSIVTARDAVQCGRLLYGVPWDTPPFSEGWKTLTSLGAQPIRAESDFDQIAAAIESHVSETSQPTLLWNADDVVSTAAQMPASTEPDK